MRHAPACAIAVAATLSFSFSFSRAARADDVRDLRTDVPVDIAVTTTAFGLVVGSELGKQDLVPGQCRWCSTNALDDGARAALRWENARPAARMSDIGGFAVAPTSAFTTLIAAAALEDASHKTPVDVLLVLEAVAVSASLNQLVKLTVARERPYAHYGSAPSRGADDRLSFYSGHTALTFTLAAAAGTVGHLRGYGLAPLSWAVGGGIAAFTGYLRIAADKHYLTDVLVGAVVGTAVGVLVPLVFHPRAEGDATAPGSVTPATRALAEPPMVSIGGAF